MTRALTSVRRAWVGVIAVVATMHLAVAVVGCAPEHSEPTRSESPQSTPTPDELPGTLSPRPSMSSAAGTQEVSVVLSSWGVDRAGISASAYTAGVVEEGGVCTLHVASAAGESTRSQNAVPTGQNTSCGFIGVPLGDVGPSPWAVWMTYETSTSVGTSEQVELTEEDMG